jgi:hypothetical protein
VKIPKLPLKEVLLLAVGVAIITTLVFTATVRDTRSDPYMALLVSQSIVQNGTIKLDTYAGGINLESHSIRQINGHYYNFYPLGTPLFSIPFVWLANISGKDMVNYDHQMQVRMAAMVCSLIFIVLYAIGRCYVSPLASFTIAGVSFLGSSLISSMGTAFWAHDFTALFTSLSLLLIVRFESGKTQRLNPYLLGFLIFSAYLCRPNSSLLIVCVFGYVLLKSRTMFIKTAAISFGLIVLLSGFSFYEYGQVLPDYYLLGVGSEGTFTAKEFWTALYGLFLSPARGIIVYSPFLVPIFAGVAVYFSQIRKNGVFWMALLWLLLQFFLLSVFQWWGGWSYGARLQVDVFPALVLISFLVWKEASQEKRLLVLRSAVASYLFLGLIGIALNSKVGLYNNYIQMWNSLPNINSNNQYLFDWKHPQFLASEELLKKKLTRHYFGDRDDVEIIFQMTPQGLSIVPVKKGTRIPFVP